MRGMPLALAPAEIGLGAHLVTRIANEVQPFHERLGIFAVTVRDQLHLEAGIHFGNGAMATTFGTPRWCTPV